VSSEVDTRVEDAPTATPTAHRVSLWLLGAFLALGLLAVALVGLLREQMVLNWAEGHRQAREIVAQRGLDFLMDERPIAVPQFFAVSAVLYLTVASLVAVLAIVGAGERLAVDVNGKFDLPTAIEFGNAIKGYGLRWYEEPLDPLDYLAHAALATQYAPPLATGENLFSMQDARNLVRHGGLRPDRDILQFDPALSYGLVEYLRTLEMLKAHGWSPRRCVPHGGHQFALNIAVGLQCGGNESYPQVFAPFGGFADDCPVVDGRVALPDSPGIGFERKADLWAIMTAM